MDTSEVALVLSDTGMKNLKREIKAIVNREMKKEVKEFFSEAEIFIRENTGEVLFYWREVAWLNEGCGFESSFPVVFIENFLNYLSEDDFHFIRLGEVEEYGYYPDNFDTSVFRQLCIRKNAGKHIKLPFLA